MTPDRANGIANAAALVWAMSVLSAESSVFLDALAAYAKLWRCRADGKPHDEVTLKNKITEMSSADRKRFYEIVVACEGS